MTVAHPVAGARTRVAWCSRAPGLSLRHDLLAGLSTARDLVQRRHRRKIRLQVFVYGSTVRGALGAGLPWLKLSMLQPR